MRAKFRCSTVTVAGSPVVKDNKLTDEQFVTSETVEFYPVYAENGPNKKWSTATPSGVLRMTINNPDAFGHFKPGKCYYLDMFEAPEYD